MRRGWKTLARKTAILAFAAFCIAAYMIDARYKRWPGNGYALDGDIFVATDNWPGFWRGALDTTAGHDIAQALSRQRNGLERYVRRATGIRPTPTRWSVWLGDRIVVSHKDDQWLACVRPGLLFHICHRLLRVAGKIELHDHHETLGSVTFSWRDGYLLLGDASMTSQVSGHDENFDATPLLIFRNRAPDAAPTSKDASLQIAATEGFPFRATFARHACLDPKPEVFPALQNNENAGPPIIDCSVQDVHAYQDLALWPTITKLMTIFDVDLAPYLLWPEVPGHPASEIADQGYAARLQVYDLPSSAGVMLPHIGMSLFRQEGPWEKHPLSEDGVRPPLMRVPYTWGATEGFLLPVLGEDFTLGCVLQGAWAHIANPPRNLPHLFIDETASPQPAPAFRAQVHWDALATEVEELLKQRQQLGLLPGDARAFDVDFGGWLQALTALGRASITSYDDTPPEIFSVEGKLAIRQPVTP